MAASSGSPRRRGVDRARDPLSVTTAHRPSSPASAGVPQWLWQFLYLGGEVKVGGVSLSILYVLVPWIGVMAAGYGFGAIMTRPPDERTRLCLRIGLGATALFAIIAGVSSRRTRA